MSENPSLPAPRRSGGQPGNCNTLKLCLSLTTLNCLVTTHSYLAHNQDQNMETLNQVLNDLVGEGFIKTE